ncbi:hypothetical protein K438DRAFT_1612927, partial [Mycena galopus ATCC 62051]
ALNPPLNIHVGMAEENHQSWVEAYKADQELKHIWLDPDVAEGRWKSGARVFRSDGNLLFFRDADFQPRLCVPKSKRKEVGDPLFRTIMWALLSRH